jgi:glycosyltransferase involved in cell wall biosynthesis
MRVLQLVKTPTGARWAMRHMRELVKLGVEVHAALPEGGNLAPEYEAAGIHLHRDQFDLPVRRPHLIPGTLRRFRALVDRVKPDLIHSHFVGTTLTMRLALGGRHLTPRLFQVPGPLHLEHTLFRTAEVRSGGAPDHWVGSCEWTVNRYRSLGVPPEKVHLAYYGLDLEDFEQKAPGKLRAELGVDGRTKIVGMVALMYPPKRYLGHSRGIKGHEDLIDALAIVAREEPDVLGVFIGGWVKPGHPYEARVLAYGRERLGDRARFLGTRTDVPDLYPDFDVVVHPSHSENVGGAGESLLLAVPTIATDVGGLPDVVKPGETGWLVPPKDPEKLAAAILQALRDPEGARRMARAGEALCRRLVDVKNTSADLLRIYERVLAGPGAADQAR